MIPNTSTQLLSGIMRTWNVLWWQIWPEDILKLMTKLSSQKTVSNCTVTTLSVLEMKRASCLLWWRYWGSMTDCCMVLGTKQVYVLHVAHKVHLKPTHMHMYIYRVSLEEWARLRESVPYVKVYRYNPKHLYPMLKIYADNFQRILNILTAITHLLSTKYILKLAGICCFYSANICT